MPAKRIDMGQNNKNDLSKKNTKIIKSIDKN